MPHDADTEAVIELSLWVEEKAFEMTVFMRARPPSVTWNG
jgi:hypothetical protein